MIRRNVRKYNKDKPESKKIKGAVSTLLKKEKLTSILIDFSCTKNKEKLNKKKEITTITVTNCDSSLDLFGCNNAPIPSNVGFMKMPSEDSFFASEPSMEGEQTVYKPVGFSWNRGGSMEGFDLKKVQESVLNNYKQGHFPEFTPNIKFNN